MSTQPKFTPGPWETVKTHGRTTYNLYAGQSSLAIINGFIGSPTLMDRADEGPANARLIAAAPDLYAACEATYAAFGLKNMLPIGFPVDLEKQLRTALAKARGEVSK